MRTRSLAAAISVTAVLALGACGAEESDKELTAPPTTVEQEPPTTAAETPETGEELSDFEMMARDEAVAGMVADGETQAGAECFVDGLITEYGMAGVAEFGADDYEPTGDEIAVFMELAADCDLSLMGTMPEGEPLTPATPGEYAGGPDPANGYTSEFREGAIQGAMAGSGLSYDQSACLMDGVYAAFGMDVLLEIGTGGELTAEQEATLGNIAVGCM